MKIWKGSYKKDMKILFSWLREDKTNKIEWLKRGLR